MTIISRPTTQGERLSRLRKFSGYTQSEMARQLGVTTSTISNWENDHVDPPLSYIARWAQLGGRSIDWIVWGDRNEEGPSSDGPSDRSRLWESNPRPSHYE